MQMVSDAVCVLNMYTDENARPTREQIEAIAIIEAFVSHWPTRSENEHHQILNSRLSKILKLEPDRFYKQRRIALAKLANYIQD